MARRPYPDQPTSRLALWARRLALFSLAAALLSVVIVNSGLLEEVRAALATFGAALALAVIALLLAFAAFVVIWKDGLSGMGAALSAIAMAVALLAYPVYLVVSTWDLPWIYDITTDVIAPEYVAFAKTRSRDANPIIYAGLSSWERQIEAYPDIEPMETDLNPRQAYDAAHAVVTKRRWRIVGAQPPDQGRKEGRIEAIARTPIMGFRDDVIVRIRANTQGSRIDIRSSSRYGTFDFGANADRIRNLIDDIFAAMALQRPEEAPPVQPAKKSKQQQPKAPPAKAAPQENGQPTAKR